MEELHQELSRVFDLISSIPVTGNSVEIMFEARERLRKIYQTIVEDEEDKNGG